jgi:PKD repeat protein/murein tripeptide amidase MpaA
MTRSYLIRLPVFLAGILTIFLLTLFVVSTSPVQAGEETPPSSSPSILSFTPSLTGTWATNPHTSSSFAVVRAYFHDPQMVADLATWTEPWEVNYDKGYVVLGITPYEFDLLTQAGFTLEFDPALTDYYTQIRTDPPGYAPTYATIPGFACYRTVEGTFATANDLVAAYPTLASFIDVGDSWDKQTAGGLPGYDMQVLILTNQALSGSKPKLFITAAIHAREYTTAELATRFAEYLLTHYGTDPDVTWILDYHEVHLMLHTNPDGRKQAEAGLSWRKNTNQNYCGTTSTSRGADLNRNFAFQWGCCGGSSGAPCDETYRGPSAGSEPETQAVQNYLRAIFPDQRGPALTDPAPTDATGVYLDIHSYSELVLWPWGFTSTTPPNSTALQTLGRKFAYFNGYEPEQAIGLYPTDGTTDDFAYGDLGVAAYTFELGTNFFQDCGTFEGTILPDNLPALLYAAKTARTPYMSPAGPESLNTAVSAGVVSAGTPVSLTATLNDTRFSAQNGTEPSQNIAAAEYYIDVPHWGTNPVAYPMTPADGSFNAKVENVTATIDTTGWTPGRHIVFMRGKDVNNNWGTVSAQFIYIVDTTVSPIIHGEVRAADTGLPLEATVSAGSVTQADTNPVTGFYEMQVISGTYDLTAEAVSPLYGPAMVADVTAQNYQTIEQNFLLYPYCTAFSDNVESGNLGWTTESPWVITTENSHTATHSWTDSPGGNYINYEDTSLTSPVFDFSNAQGVTLNFWQLCDTEAGYDYCTVEVSTNGTSWTAVASYDGPHSAWEYVSLPIPQLDNQPTAYIRFHFTSDQSVVDDGWHIDDIELISAGPGCVEEVAPLASFASSSPDLLGTTTMFTNTSLGTDLTYQWDFGDGNTSTETHPTHLYTSLGAYTVTLTASNNVGDHTATQQVYIVETMDATVSGTVYLQGRDDPSGAVITVWLAETPVFSLTTDVTGLYTFTVPAGVYQLTIEFPQYLDAARSLNLLTGDSTALGSVTLLAGDVNDNDKINIVDLALIGAHYDLNAGDPGWDARADLNNDGTVNLQDLVLAAGNFQRTSPVPWEVSGQ